MSHGILHYLSLMIVSKFIFCQYFFSRFCPVEKCGVTTTAYTLSYLIVGGKEVGEGWEGGGGVKLQIFGKKK